MNKPKSHHFVPQFYLRRFSDDGRSIRLLHKPSNRIIERAPIKGQCAIDNFHGWHQAAESSLATIEGECAASIDKVVKAGKPPQRNSTDYGHLLLFVALQSMRTQQSAEASNALTDHFAKMMAQGRPEFANIDLSSVRINEKYPVAMPIAIALQAHQKLSDLDMRLLTTSEKQGFLTSDNPVALYNSSRADVWWEGATGIDCEGLQIFLPLSRSTCLYLFDLVVYRSASNTLSRVLGSSDLTRLNALTILNSHTNVYGLTLTDLEMARELRKITQSYEQYDRLVFTETERYSDDEGKLASLIAHYRLHAPLISKFRFAKQRRPAGSGARSDRTAWPRRKVNSFGATVRELKVVTSTLNGPRAMLGDATLEQFARRYFRSST